MKKPLERQLRWQACYNVRDLGGYDTEAGSQTRKGALVRADNLCRLTPEGRAALVSHGVRTILDLRSAFELRLDPSPFGEPAAHPDAPTYLNLPLLEPSDAALTAAINAASSAQEIYVLVLERCRAQMATVVTAVAGAPEGGVLLYCHAGKDRTGLVVAVLLALAGVPQATIAADYSLSDVFLRPLYDQQLRKAPDPLTRHQLERQLRSPLNAARPETMVGTLSYLDAQHHGVRCAASWRTRLSARLRGNVPGSRARARPSA